MFDTTPRTARKIRWALRNDYGDHIPLERPKVSAFVHRYTYNRQSTISTSLEAGSSAVKSDANQHWLSPFRNAEDGNWPGYERYNYSRGPTHYNKLRPLSALHCMNINISMPMHRCLLNATLNFWKNSHSVSVETLEAWRRWAIISYTTRDGDPYG